MSRKTLGVPLPLMLNVAWQLVCDKELRITILIPEGDEGFGLSKKISLTNRRSGCYSDKIAYKEHQEKSR